MGDLVKADPAAIAAFGTQHAGMAGQVAGSAAADVVGSLASAVPVFGLIGQDFLAAFAQAQFSFLQSSAEIAAVHAGIATGALEGAATYTGTELGNANSFISSIAGLL
ncbi:type VII secretion target [Nocardia sp. BMG111209]|uniref:type VII secretion target n=1 Tax=Nocardia sp. BMG111209 TaxID=1160137 RepID=UPI0003A666F6|nr:type VII secretion target [Nocardia sp. BMG111209]